MSVFNRMSRRPSARPAIWLFAVAIAVAHAGCGEPDPLSGAKFFPVKGKVLLHDGKPLNSGSVVFLGSKTMVTSLAKIENDGSFEFKSDRAPGLPEDEYRVRVEYTLPTSANGPRARSTANLPFASKYLDEDTSGLKATVTPDESKNSFQFSLETNDSAERGSRRRRR